MGRLRIVNASIVLPDSVIVGDLLIEDGKIAAIGRVPTDADTPTLDAQGGYVMAGFIDIHVHGGGNADFMDATPQAFETVVRTHLRYGTTLMTPTAMSATEADLSAFIKAYHAFKAQSPYAHLAYGLHLEGPYFAGAQKSSSGAQPTDVLRCPDMAEVDRLMRLADGAIVRWDAAPELPDADVFAKELVKRGVQVAVGHSDATAEETERAYAAGFSHVTHFYNAISSHRKRGQKVRAGIVEATYLDDAVSVELIGDGCHIVKQDMALALKIKGRQKVAVITDAMRLAGTTLSSGKLGSLRSGTDCIVDDGVAKLMDMSSFAGSICTMERALGVLCRDFGFDLPTASAMMSATPASLLGCADCKGSIAIGMDADLVVVDSSFCVRDVVVGGTHLHHSDM